MDPDRYRRIEEIFHAAIDVPRERRAAFVRTTSGDDESLRIAIEELLAADADPEAGALDSLSAEYLASALDEETDAHRDDESIVGSQFGPWRIERLLGEGGMGRVFVATRADRAFDMRVAVKLLRSGALDRRGLDRFERERRLLARLDHPGIARLLDGGATADGTPWLAMELVDGERIDAFCDSRALPIRARIELMIAVCAAVDHAHRRLLVHRDLKPSNVLVDRDGRPRLVDFGIARLIERDDTDVLTEADDRLLTPRYASPEQVRGEPAGVASDVYSLGILLHELLTGASPYPGDTGSRYALERAICESEPVAPSTALAASADAQSAARVRSASVAQLAKGLRGDLDHVVLRCLRKDPERRYASVADFAADLERHRDGMPVRARGDAFGYRAAKFIRRNPVGTMVSALLVVALGFAAVQHLRGSRRDANRLAVILPLTDLQRARDLQRDAATLWPMTAAQVPACHDWLRRARALLVRRESHERGLAAIDGLDLDDDQRLWLANGIRDLLAEFDRLAAPDAFADTIAGVERRIEVAVAIESLDLRHAREWDEAVAAIAASPRYGGLRIGRQVGLVPLGADPSSGLHEFVHVSTGATMPSGAPSAGGARGATGDLPSRAADGSLELDAQSGVILVLIPGGERVLGAQRTDPDAPSYDPDAKDDEGPPRIVRLAPFFLAKHELTQGQWRRITGAAPSTYLPGSKFGAQTISPANPVESISNVDAVDALRRVDLELPTEEQWEYACRAGSIESTPFATGRDPLSLIGSANFADRFARENGGDENWQYSDFDDGATVHARIGSYAPNAFGLYDLHGNVWEWCAGPPHAGASAGGDRVARGGGFFNPPSKLRASGRYFVSKEFRSRSLGVRAARRVE